MGFGQVLLSEAAIEGIPQKKGFSLHDQIWINTMGFGQVLLSEAATEGILQKKIILKILQNSQENTFSKVSFLIKLQALGRRDSNTGIFLWILRNF